MTDVKSQGAKARMLVAKGPADVEVDVDEEEAELFDRASWACHVRDRAKMRFPMLSTWSAGVSLPKPSITSTKSLLFTPVALGPAPVVGPAAGRDAFSSCSLRRLSWVPACSSAMWSRRLFISWPSFSMRSLVRKRVSSRRSVRSA